MQSSNTQRKERNLVTKSPSFLLLFLIIITQSALSILPGILLYHQQQGQNWQGAFLLIAYLFVSNLSELAVRLQYRKENRFPMVAYGIKLLICSVLIVWFASVSQYQFALILFGYELFQTLANSRQFFYLDSFYYTLLNPIFKGFVLNLLFLMKAPIFFDPQQITTLLPAFFVSIVITLFQQGQVSLKNRKSFFLMGFVVMSLATCGGIVYLHLVKDYYALWKMGVFIICALGGTMLAFSQRNFLKAEFALNICYLAALGVLYF